MKFLDEQDCAQWHRQTPLWVKQLMDEQIPGWRDMTPPDFQNVATAWGAATLAVMLQHQGHNGGHLDSDEFDEE